MAENHPRSPGANTAGEQDAKVRQQLREQDSGSDQPEDRKEELVDEAFTPGAPGAAGGGDVRLAAEQARQAGDAERAQSNVSRPGPSPYDVAEPGTPPDRVIKKGERERPGPTDEEMPTDTGDLPDDEHARRLNEVEATRGSGRSDYPDRHS